MLEVIQSEASAAPIGPYSQAIKAGGFVFVAGEKECVLNYGAW